MDLWRMLFGSSDEEVKSEEPKILIGNKDCNFSSSYVIHNYLKTPTRIRVVASKENGGEAAIGRESAIGREIAIMGPETSASLLSSNVTPNEIFQPGNLINIYTTIQLPTGPKEILYNSYTLTHQDLWSPERKPLNSLHIGQISTRAINTALTNRPTNSQGLGAILIHNVSNVAIHINDFTVAPHSTFRWRGPMKYGIPLGTYFVDNSPVKLYPTWQLIRPVTDIYYGLTSHIKQELYGGYDFAFDDYPDNITQYLTLTK
jgi:hypothetical protein